MCFPLSLLNIEHPGIAYSAKNSLFLVSSQESNTLATEFSSNLVIFNVNFEGFFFSLKVDASLSSIYGSKVPQLLELFHSCTWLALPPPALCFISLSLFSYNKKMYCSRYVPLAFTEDCLCYQSNDYFLKYILSKGLSVFFFIYI